MQMMKTFILILFLICVFVAAEAQCSICSKTASQMGQDAARGLNGGIIYLAAAPFLVLSYIGYRWWKNNNSD
jgi:hypothetical protein